MAKREYTNAEWQEMIDAAVLAIPSVEEEVGQVDHPTPPALDNLDELGQYIDHTLLKLDATDAQIVTLCEEAKTYGFKCCCVRPKHVRLAVESLRDTSVVVACVIGFHEGTYATEVKVAEAQSALALGAQELDMVINPIHLHTRNYTALHDDIAAVRRVAVTPTPYILKCILETSTLTRSQIIAAGLIAMVADVDFLKTSTGFTPSTTNHSLPKDVALLKSLAHYYYYYDDNMNTKKKNLVRVKASGGIRSWESFSRVRSVGADRVGTSSGVAIVRDARAAAAAAAAAAGAGAGAGAGAAEKKEGEERTRVVVVEEEEKQGDGY